MPRKGEKLEKTQVGDPSDPLGFAHLRDMHLEYLTVRNYSLTTVRNRESYLNRFILWTEERSLSRPEQVTKQILDRYQRWLYNYRDAKTGKKLSFRSQHARLLPLRAFFKWLCQRDLLPANPAADLDLPKLEKRLPRHVLNAKEAELVLGQADTLTAMGLRDRAMMEVLYSTGIRRMEIANLKLYDIDAERRLVFVRLGKGKKDRMVPIGERALAWTNKYLEESRPSLSCSKSDGALFLTNLGEAFTANRLTQMVREYVNAADIGKSGSCHLFRHACATHMLENGADTRMIQALLGHARLETTQIYTHLSIKQLQQVHEATHPAANLGKRSEGK
ncbi:site-specific tyrosine recombinase XerC [Puniceicoccaceae bacterium K14]|nr:site-specific tyrosine recombinase XerC [Puniceicoccaceae bacterium K14]